MTGGEPGENRGCPERRSFPLPQKRDGLPMGARWAPRGANLGNSANRLVRRIASFGRRCPSRDAKEHGREDHGDLVSLWAPSVPYAGLRCSGFVSLAVQCKRSVVLLKL